MMNSISNRVHHAISKLDKTGEVYCECEWFNYNYIITVACRCPVNRNYCATALCSAAQGSRLGAGQLPPTPLATPLRITKMRLCAESTPSCWSEIRFIHQVAELASNIILIYTEDNKSEKKRMKILTSHSW